MLSIQFNDEYLAYYQKSLQAAILEKELIANALLEFVKVEINCPLWLTTYSEEQQIEFTKSLIILAELKEERAFPLMMKLFSLDTNEYKGAADLLYNLNECHGLSRILASICNGQLDLIKQIVENPKYHFCVRMSALESLLVLYNSERLTREELIEYFQKLLDNEFYQDENQEDFFLQFFMDCCNKIYPAELYFSLLEHCTRMSKCFGLDFELTALLDTDERQCMDNYYVSNMLIFNNCMRVGKKSMLARLKDDYLLRSIDKGFPEIKYFPYL